MIWWYSVELATVQVATECSCEEKKCHERRSIAGRLCRSSGGLVASLSSSIFELVRRIARRVACDDGICILAAVTRGSVGLKLDKSGAAQPECLDQLDMGEDRLRERGMRRCITYSVHMDLFCVF